MFIVWYTAYGIHIICYKKSHKGPTIFFYFIFGPWNSRVFASFHFATRYSIPICMKDMWMVYTVWWIWEAIWAFWARVHGNCKLQARVFYDRLNENVSSKNVHTHTYLTSNTQHSHTFILWPRICINIAIDLSHPYHSPFIHINFVYRDKNKHTYNKIKWNRMKKKNE